MPSWSGCEKLAQIILKNLNLKIKNYIQFAFEGTVSITERTTVKNIDLIKVDYC